MQQVALLDQLEEMLIGKIFAGKVQGKDNIVGLERGQQCCEGSAEIGGPVVEDAVIEMRRQHRARKPQGFELLDRGPSLSVGSHPIIDKREQMTVKI
jgi:hypothetical protein